MRRERTFDTAERVAAAVAARLACLHEDGAPPSSSSTAALVELYRSVAASGDDASVDGVTARARKELSKLRFALHETFWDAVPFAILPLQTKVAGSRKCTELVKISKAGVTPLLNFLEMAFGRQVRNVTLASEEAEEAAYAEGGASGAVAAAALEGRGQSRLTVLAPALFGGH